MQHSQMYFLERILDFDPNSIEVLDSSAIDNMPAKVQVVAWQETGNYLKQS